MDLPNTLRQLLGNPQIVAWRPSGLVIRVREGGVIERVFIPRPYRWQPKLEDLVAGDWVYGSREQLEKFITAAQESEQ